MLKTAVPFEGKWKSGLLVGQPSVSSFPGGASCEESACRCRTCKRHGIYPWVGKIPGV